MGIGNDYLKHHVRIMLINKKIDFYLKNNKKNSNKMTDLSREDLSKLTIVKLKDLAKEHNINKCSNKKKDVLVDYLYQELQSKKERIQNTDDEYDKFKECVNDYEKESGRNFIEDLLQIKKINEETHTYIESIKKDKMLMDEEISKEINNLRIDEFKDFQPDVHTHELDDTKISTFIKKNPTEQYKFFIKSNKHLKFGDIIILSNNDCEVKKIYHVCDDELAEDISLCDADWMSLGIPKEISKKFENMDELLRIYKNHVIEAFEFSDDYFCVQLESNHPFLKKKFDDIEEKHIEIMKDWDIRYLFEGEPLQEVYQKKDDYDSIEKIILNADFEIITPKCHEEYHCSEYYGKSIKKIIQFYKNKK